MDFTGKIVALTGAASGFGRAIGQGFAARGARVWGTDIDAGGLARVDWARTEALDLSDRAAAAAWVARVEEEAGGAIDVLVNNAGGSLGTPFRPIDELDDASWDRLFAINIHASMATCRAAAGAMKRAGTGAIVNITSGAGLKPSLTGLQGYCSAKHALVGLTRQLAVELGPHGIRVNSVAPGLVLTDDAKIRRWEGYTEEKRQAKLAQTALGRLGAAEDIANAVLFLASDMAGYISGQILSVDGGSL
jgi:3-oxoacyl-[acyl-carrier protein] reductase